MFESALGIIKVIGPIVLLVALAYAVFHVRRRGRKPDRARDDATRRLYTDEGAQRDNLKYGARVGEPEVRPGSPTPNDIT